MRLSFNIIIYFAALVVILEFIDSALTYFGLSLGFKEINPRMIFFIEKFGKEGAFLAKLPTLPIPLIAYTMIKFEPKNKALKVIGYSIAIFALVVRSGYLVWVNLNHLILLI